MVQSITIAGQTPEQVLDVRTYSRGGDELGAGEIVVADTQTNRNIVEPGNDVAIQWSDYSWGGYVTAEESGEQPETLRIKAIGARLPLKHSQLHTVFYNRPSSAAVTQAVTERSKPLGEVSVHVASDMSQWTSNAPVAERYAGTRAGIYDAGTDLLVLGVRGGHTGTITATYEGVTSDMVVDGIYELTTRLLVNDRGGLWDTEIELTTPDGTTYVWEPDIGSSTFETLTLPAEEATPDGQVDATGTLQYRFTPAARVPSNTAIMIDYARTKPFERKDRASPLGTGSIRDTDRTITRRVDGPAAVFIDEQATEDGFSWWVDESDTLHYQPGDEEPSNPGLEIVAGTTQVTDVDATKDYEDIVNVVTVQGAGNISVTERDQASVDYYGPVPRAEAIVDESIHSETEARSRAQGHLEKNAWDDARVGFAVADTAFAALEYGDEITVQWPPQGLDGTYKVAETETTSIGVVTVTIKASSGD